MNVLSLFDGISCGQLALHAAGFSDFTYYASEIDPAAIRITQRNFPNTIQLGDVRDIDALAIPPIDLLIGGSPCQGFSLSGKQENFNDPRSALFFEFVRILYELRPTYFLLENVPMQRRYQDVISYWMSCDPIIIDSSDFVPQHRKRLYWTNITIGPHRVTLSCLSGILDPKRDERNNVADNIYRKSGRSRRRAESAVRRLDEKARCLNAEAPPYPGTNGFTGIYFGKKHIYRMSVTECERAQGVPTGYTAGECDTARYAALGNGWTVPVIAHIFSGLPR